MCCSIFNLQYDAKVPVNQGRLRKLLYVHDLGCA